MCKPLPIEKPTELQFPLPPNCAYLSLLLPQVAQLRLDYVHLSALARSTFG